MIDVLTGNKRFCENVRSLYGKDANVRDQAERYTLLGAEHINRFAVSSFEFFSSPGRIEICGNHTDHNHGKVLTAAITMDTLSAVTPVSERKVNIYSAGYPLICVDLDDLTLNPAEKGTSTAITKGVAKYFVDHGYNVGGFCATTTSNVFKGAGVSSSSSFELLVAEIFNVLYNDGNIGDIEKAKAGQWAEKEYFGKPCGLMDQSAIALGGVSFIDFENPNDPIVEKVHWNFSNTSIILVNTGGDHCALTHCYADIKKEMEAIAKHFGKEVLRQVSTSDFYSDLVALKNKFSGRAIMRAIHYFDENRRVEKALDAAKNQDDSFFDFVNQSGESSYKYLQNCFAPGDVEQPVALALSIISRFDGVKAIRVHGGGFAGTIIVFAEGNGEDIVEKTRKLYGSENVFKVDIRDSGACNTGLRMNKTEA